MRRKHDRRRLCTAVQHCLPAAPPTRRFDVQVDPATITVSNILNSRGWEAAAFNYAANGHQPYVVGKPIPLAGSPDVAVIGTSHCEMYGPLMRQLAEEYGRSVAFLCQDGDMGRFRRPGNAAWDQIRLDHLDSWKGLDLLLYIDFWGGDSSPPWWYENHDWNATIATLATRANRVKLFGDVPTLPISPRPSNDLFKTTVYRQFQRLGTWNFLVEMQEEPAYGARRLVQEGEITRAASSQPNCAFVPVSPYFTHAATSALHVVNPDLGTLAYKDFGHLNADGALMVEELFRREVFGEHACP